MKNTWAISKNSILIIAFFAFNIFMMFQTETIQAWFTLPPEAGFGEARTTPWHYINRDFAKGVGSLITVTFSLAVIIPLLKKCWPESLLVALYAGIYNVNNITILVLIMLNTQNYFDPAHATSSWHSFEAYFDATDYGLASLIIFVLLVLPLSAYLTRRTRKTKEKFGMYFPPKDVSSAGLK